MTTSTQGATPSDKAAEAAMSNVLIKAGFRLLGPLRFIEGERDVCGFLYRCRSGQAPTYVALIDAQAFHFDVAEKRRGYRFSADLSAGECVQPRVYVESEDTVRSAVVDDEPVWPKAPR
jgi:hypothetical protein